MDFKGYFRCGNRQRCDPFTITDGYSRFIIRCQTVGLRKMEGDLFEVYFGATLLGEIDGYRKTLRRRNNYRRACFLAVTPTRNCLGQE